MQDPKLGMPLSSVFPYFVAANQLWAHSEAEPVILLSVVPVCSNFYDDQLFLLSTHIFLIGERI